MNLDTGSVVGDYEIIGVLGAGGMGKVFKVRNLISNRIEAMKVLLPDLSGEPELADRFLREIQVLARLEHPNIAGLRTALRHENQLLMVMEMVEGVSIDERLKSGPMPMPEAVKCAQQVLAALAFAHKNGVVHRDIKPANMMLMPNGTVKLMDFGIAKGATDRRLTMTGGTIGSVYYMSPEQISGAEGVDARSDLYSVGVSLYEMVTGKHAFDGDSQFSIMSAHLEKTPVPPITIDPSIPPALNEIIMVSVARDAGARFQTADAFRNALGSVVDSTVVLPPPVAPQGAPQIVGAVPERKSGGRALWATVGALCFVAVLVAAIQFGPWKKASAGAQETNSAQPAVVTPAPVTPAPVPAPAPIAEQPAAQSTPAPVAEPPAPVPGSAPVKERAARQVPQTSRPASASSTPAQSAPIQQAPVQQPPVQQSPVQQAASVQQPQPQSPPQPDPAIAHRAEMQRVRESVAMLGARAGSIHSTLQNLQRSQAASGLGMRGDWVQMANLMDTYLRGSSDALAAGDLVAAKDFAEKSERQIERLEKALNK